MKRNHRDFLAVVVIDIIIYAIIAYYWLTNSIKTP